MWFYLKKAEFHFIKSAHATAKSELLIFHEDDSMAKLLRWLRSLWFNHTRQRKGEEEDDHLEDCYVPQRSIHDTVSVNEEIDQRLKLNRVSKSTSMSLGGASSPLPSSTCCTKEAAVQCNAEDFALRSERSASPMGLELSDTDTEQMFPELEKQCLEKDDAPSEEEVPVGTGGPPGTARAAEGPPAVPDGSAPDNEPGCVGRRRPCSRCGPAEVAQRAAQLEEALLHCEKFQDTLEPFLSWLEDTEELISTQKPPSAEYRMVKAQIQKQKCFMQTIKEEMEELHDELDIVLLFGIYLTLPSDETEKPEVKSTDEVNNTWENLNKTWKKKLENLEEGMQLAVQYQDTLQAILDRLDNVVIEQRNMSPLSTDLSTAKEQMNEAKFHKAWKELLDWLEDAENQLDSELEISNDPDYIELQLSKHKEFQKTLGGKQPVYDTTIRMGRALKEKALLPDDTPKLDNFLGEVQEKWDTVCRKSEERQHKLEEALLFSGQFLDELHALLDWLHKVEPQLDDDQPVHGDLDLVMNLMDAHKVFQKELGKRTATVQMLKRSGQELIENSQDDTAWVKVQLQEVINRWDRVCKLSMSKQARLEKALKQAEQFGTAVHMLLEWLSEAEQSLCFQGAVPDDAKALQSLIDSHKEFMRKVEEKGEDVNTVVGMGNVILATCHPDCITTIKHWITTILDRFEKILTWVKQHHQRLESVLSELVANAQLLEEPLAWIQLAESTLLQRDQEPMPQNIGQVKALIAEHQSFMEEMIWKQTDVYRVTETNKWKSTEPPSGPFIEKSRSNRKPLNRTALPSMPVISQSDMKNPRRNQLSARWEQLWRLVLAREQKLNDALQRLEKTLKNQSVIPPATLGAVQAAGPAAAGEVTPPILTSWKHSQRAPMLPGAAWPAGRAARARGRRNPPKSQS
ncbi:microtubule-actin cross-linking factor 1, isoforms 6/7-like [Podargus strigoides]